MQNKIYLLLLVLLLIVVQSISLDLFSRKSKKDDDDDDSVDDVIIDTSKYNQVNDDQSQLSANRRNRYSSYGTSSNNYRPRSRWSSSSSPSSSSISYDDRSNSNDRSPYGYGPNNILSNYPGPLPPAAFDSGAYLSNGPSCYSLLDPIYPLFSDICGSVPQARYSLPNAFGHLERWQIAQVLTVLLGPSTPSSANPVCSRSLRLLLCPLLFPPCPTRYEAPPVLPCQPFCRIVKNQCAAPSLELLPCDLLPPTSDLCPISPTPFNPFLSPFGPPSPLNGPISPFGPPSPFNGPMSPFGSPQSALSNILAQSALSPGFSPMDMPPSLLSSILSQSGGLSPMDMPPSFLQSILAQSAGLSPSPFPQMPPPSPFPQMFPPPPPYGSAMMPPGVPSSGLSSFLSSSGMSPSAFPPSAMSSLSPMNPFFNPDSFMPDNLTPILVDFPPLQYGQGFQQAPRYFPFTRSATEKV